MCLIGVTVVSAARDRLSAAPFEAGAHDRALDLLSGMAVALGHDADLDFLLAELASGVRRTLDADRVSVLLLDDAGRLSPAVAVARQHNDDLWQRFRKMPPIALDDLPGARQALAQGRVLVIDDASVSPLVPIAWQRTFELGSLAVAPLLVDDCPAGLVAVEYGEARAPFTPTQLTLVEGMAALAGIALRAGRQRNQVQRLATMSAAVRAMAGVRTTRAVAEQALSALLETAKVGHGLFAQLTQMAVEVVAVRGQQLPEPGRYDLTVLPVELVTTCQQAWLVDPRALVGVELRGSALSILPIAGPKGPIALVVLPVAFTVVPADVVGELQLLADATAMQLHAAMLVDDRTWHRRALSLRASVSAQLTEPDGVAALVEEARILLADAGLEAPRVVTERNVARATGVSAARADVARLLTRWRRIGSPEAPVHIGAESAVPLRGDGRIVGALLWRAAAPTLDARTEQVIVLLGDVLGRALAQHEAVEAEQRVTEATAHAAIASRAYQEAGQLLALLSNHLHAGAVEGPRTAAAEMLVTQARRLLRDATEVLAPTTAPQADLRVALTALAKQICAHGGPDTVVRQIGRAPLLDVAVQVAVLRATQRALALLRELRAVAAVVSVEALDGEVVIAVRADELIAAASEVGAPGLRAALRDARAWLSPVEGSIEISYDAPHHGFVVRAPAGGSQPAHTARRGESTTARLLTN
ncbi:MAG: hypothetical protein JWO88_2979 [Frankiales bacterium]|nr:hypothetical protein [Frankiales bacterium]